MKKLHLGVISFLLIVLIAGCGGSNIDIELETVPNYKDGESYPIVIQVEENGELAKGFTIVATLEMAKMDHGIIEVHFTDNQDGTYSGEVELPMAGEWIANVEVDAAGEVTEEIVVFDVKEG